MAPTPPPEPPPATSPGQKEGSAEKTVEPLIRLREFFKRQGATLEEGWSIEIKHRSGGSTAGTTDTYYHSPKGKRYRSRVEIARDYGLVVEPPARKQTSLSSFFEEHKPVSRPEAVSGSAACLASLTLPLTLANGTTITSLGTGAAVTGTEPPTLLPVGFEAERAAGAGSSNRIHFSIDEGPVCRILLGRPGEGLELGAGASPDAAWTAAAASTALQESGHAAVPDGLKQDLEMGWGTERFGLASLPVLKAVEGLPNVKDVPGYKYVDEGEGWSAVGARLRAQLTQRGIMKAKSKPGKPSEKVPGGKKADAKAVAKAMDSMIRRIEREEERRKSMAEKSAAALERKALKQMESEAQRSQAVQAQHALFLARAAAIQQSREANAVRDDAALPGAHLPPPTPKRLGCGAIPAEGDALLLEIWLFAHRFQGLLGLEAPLPTIAQLEAGLVMEGFHQASAPDEEVPSPYTLLCMALCNLLCIDLFDGAMEALEESRPEVREADYRPSAKAQHPLPVTPESWPEAAARILRIHAAAARADRGLASRAKGTAEPLAVLGPDLLLDLLVAGLDAATAQRVGGLPPHAGPQTAASIRAAADAAGRAAAIAGDGKLGVRAREGSHGSTPLLRAALLRLCSGRHARALAWHGAEAAAATRAPRELDLAGVGRRVEAGAYAMAANPLEALAVDVEAVVALHAGLAGKQSEAAVALQSQGVVEGAATVASLLEACLAEIRKDGPETFIQGVERAHPKLARHLRDVSRPFSPFPGCAVCWDEGDEPHTLICDGCDIERHMYCLPVPLEEVPEGAWQCPACDPTSKGKDGLAGQSGGAPKDCLTELGEFLSTHDIWQAAPAARLNLLHALTQLVAESRMVHTSLVEEEESARQLRREIQGMRVEIRTWHAEAALRSAGGAAAQEGVSARATRSVDPLSQIEAAVQRTSRLEHELSKTPVPRLTPIGVDRHWNRYWLLPQEAFAEVPSGGGAAVLGVDRPAPSDASAPAERWTAGIYPGPEELDRLLRWLDPRGVRERALAAEARRLHAESLASQEREEVREAEARAAPAEAQQAQDGAEQGFDATAPPVADVMQPGEDGTALAPGAAPAPDAAPAPEAAPAPDAATATDALEPLRSAVLALQEGWAAATLQASEEELIAWRESVVAAVQPVDLARALLRLEGWVRPEFFKVHWRFWAAITPHPGGLATPAALWMRYEALKSAVKLRVTLKLPGSAPTTAGGTTSRPPSRGSGRYPLRERRAAVGAAGSGQKRPWWDALEDGETSDSPAASAEPAADDRASRLAKRQRAQEREAQAESERGRRMVERSAGGRSLRSKPADEVARGRLREGRRAGRMRQETPKIRLQPPPPLLLLLHRHRGLQAAWHDAPVQGMRLCVDHR
ncbi:hypothetical protein ACKKBG_A21055 [Auxenochlorella protothecoides x Auxenochlorella symbiontica]